MAARPSALRIHASHAWCSVCPLYWIAKSTIDVVPPNAAAIVPDSKSSADVVPPNGISRCVWTSMPPGRTYLPAASITLSAPWTTSSASDDPMSAIFSPSISTSPRYRSTAVTTVPPLITVRISKPLSTFFNGGGAPPPPRIYADASLALKNGALARHGRRRCSSRPNRAALLEPSRDGDFLVRVELEGVAAVRLQIAEEAVLRAAEGKIRHRRGDADVDAHHR